MSEISFKSTYKIPVTQWGINNTKKITIIFFKYFFILKYIMVINYLFIYFESFF